MRILVAEDDEFLLSALCLGLRRSGYFVDEAKTGQEASSALWAASYDLVLLDLGLPGVDGVEIIRQLRASGARVPIIVITARDGVEDRILGLDLGANDYVVKPFDFRELQARIRAALRKTHWDNEVEVSCGAICFNATTRQVSVGGAVIELTPREVSVLELLLSRAGRVVQKRQIIEQMSEWETEVSDNALEIVIHRLRRKLRTAKVTIRTVRGFGYVLEEAQ